MVATQYFRCWPFRQRIYFLGFLWRRSPWLMPVSPGNELSMKISAFHFWKRSINNMLQLLLVEIKAHWWNSMLWTKKRRSDSPLYLRGTRNRWMFSQLIVKDFSSKLSGRYHRLHIISEMRKFKSDASTIIWIKTTVFQKEKTIVFDEWWKWLKIIPWWNS